MLDDELLCRNGLKVDIDDEDADTSALAPRSDGLVAESVRGLPGVRETVGDFGSRTDEGVEGIFLFKLSDRLGDRPDPSAALAAAAAAAALFFSACLRLRATR